MRRDLTPVQSGCCKPPTSCVYGGDGLTGQGPAVVAVQDEDCFRWQNDPAVLCYGCDSCRAGVMEQLRRHWHNVTVVNAVLLLLLIAVCSCGCCAFRNARRAEYAYAGRMSKIHPRWDYFWSVLLALATSFMSNYSPFTCDYPDRYWTLIPVPASHPIPVPVPAREDKKFPILIRIRVFIPVWKPIYAINKNLR
ncbi:hypothetical protein TRIUR3_29686 [Triticum urartu]|uniref:Uncharacterized protein n=1 Tax=Triticum urartu TaxID=4572 RepID=M7ZYM1_TRIUA|nr:hypothetical protein TRIUR3_29686 [Triticum urartu]